MNTSTGTPIARASAAGLSARCAIPASNHARVDSKSISADDAYAYYGNTILDIANGSILVARVAPDAATSAALSDAATMFRAIEAMARAHALAAAAVRAGGLNAGQRHEFSQQIGYFRTAIADVGARLDQALRQQLEELHSALAWQRSSTFEDAILSEESEPNRNPRSFDLDAWQSDSDQVGSALLALWRGQNVSAQQIAARAGERDANNSLLGGAGAILVALVALTAGLLLANRLIGRLKCLRDDTVALADDRLPQIIADLREGGRTDADPSSFRLDHGADEIGEVAEAFNRAQQVAIAAAVAEARTRMGINAVFVNIAHRNQVLVHRQLAVLDDAEREVEDPAHLQRLFQLDHLATQVRRNAENLIVLGGEQPGRRWTSPMPLIDVVRSAVAETVEYTRVDILRLPPCRIAGPIVADLVHLLAELMDNAATFSPPDTRVEVTGVAVGRGIALTIADQGLGMPAEDLDERNRFLRNPPDFSIASLVTDTRLGLFVVAKLAGRHGVSVRLRESNHGGVQAIVVLPLTFVVEDDTVQPTTSRVIGSK
ncbi:HAMP domain-containing protein [Nocardia sp. CT2-14]|uniref:histidine kinase n=1 Tax=Nocardia aurantiaca TaxID=2675850 RepID=A0A6I3L5Y2_9NOCA|nr:HAMP domain-containing protein [Nocardia aurantiaca]